MTHTDRSRHHRGLRQRLLDQRWPGGRPPRDDGFSPRLWRVGVVVPLALGAAAIALGVITAGVLAVFPGSRSFATTADSGGLAVIKTALAIATFFGAALAGVYAYRRQRISEAETLRADETSRLAVAEGLRAQEIHIAQRFGAATEQLGHEKAAVRLAGAYALARLADEARLLRVECVSVLCSYLRMPADGRGSGDQQVCEVILSIMRERLQDPQDGRSWCGIDLDLHGAQFIDGSLEGAHFVDCRVDLTSCVFAEGGSFSFADTIYDNVVVRFDRTAFKGRRISFRGARMISRMDATDIGVSFQDCAFLGQRVSFKCAEVALSYLRFNRAKFDSNNLDFGGCKITGEILFDDAQFSRSEVNFDYARFPDGAVYFGESQFTDSRVSFAQSEFDGTNWYFELRDVERSEFGFACAKFRNGLVRFQLGPRVHDSTFGFWNSDHKDRIVQFIGEFSKSKLEFSSTLTDMDSFDLEHFGWSPDDSVVSDNLGFPVLPTKHRKLAARPKAEPRTQTS